MRNGSAPPLGGGAAHTREQTLPPLAKSRGAAPGAQVPLSTHLVGGSIGKFENTS